MNSSERMKKISVWLLAARPKTLFAAASPVLAGCALSFKLGKLRLFPALACLACSFLIQISANLINDLYDFLQGKDTENRAGPARALASGWISKKEMTAGILLILSVALLLGLYIFSEAGYPVIIIGVASIISGYLYTAGPYPLAYHGLGDIFVFIFFGLVATCGTFYVLCLSVSFQAISFGAIEGLLISNILVVNNYRDYEEDRVNGKNTLSVIFGRRFSVFQYIFSILASYLIGLRMIADSASGRTISLGVTLMALSLPLALKLIFEMKPGQRLNSTLAKTGIFCLLFTILLSLGLIL